MRGAEQLNCTFNPREDLHTLTVLESGAGKEMSEITLTEKLVRGIGDQDQGRRSLVNSES